MRVLFITKPFFIEPLGIMHLVARAKACRHEADLITTAEDIDAKIEEFKPELLAYSIMTGDQEFYSKLNQRLKTKYNIYSIAGGPHPTYFPEMIKTYSFDAICVGEGELAFDLFLKHRDPNDDEFKFIDPPNITTKQKRSRYMCDLIKNLDSLSFPDRACVFKYPHIGKGPIKHFMASRGCPFDCTYCFNASYAKLYGNKGKRVRWRSVKNLVIEIKQVISMSPTKVVYFQDDTFIANRAWLREFAPLYSQEIGLPYHCHVRADLINEEIAELLSYDCSGVHLAIEAGSEKVRRHLLKRRMTNRKIKGGIQILKEKGYIKNIMTQNILGLPETTLYHDLETLELNIQCKPLYAWASIFHPYPRTWLGEHAKAIGVYTGDFSDLNNNFFDTSPLDIPHANEVANLQKLFAIAVEHPEIYRSGLLMELIHLPYEATRERFTKLYKDFRKTKDNKLYGVTL